jgi:adenylate kinase
MMLVLLGPPGSGKGTQAERLVSELGFQKISMGDLFRMAIQKKDRTGRRVRQYLAKGKLVPDSTVMEMVEGELAKHGKGADLVFDGFPRSVNQALAFNGLLDRSARELDMVLYFDIPFALLTQRLTRRRVCPKCGAVYNLDTAPPVEGIRCDRCGSPLAKREDDTEEVVRKRFKVYEQETAPIVDYYGKKGVLVTVDAAGDENIVWKHIRNVIAIAKKGVDEKQEY